MDYISILLGMFIGALLFKVQEDKHKQEEKVKETNKLKDIKDAINLKGIKEQLIKEIIKEIIK